MSQRASTPKTLEYGKSKEMGRWRSWSVPRLLIISGFLLLFIASIVMGKEALVCLAATAFFIVLFLCMWTADPKRLPDAEEERLDDEWENRKAELAAVASQVYAKFPIGMWAAKWTTPGPSRLSPTVQEERFLQLHKDGSGSFKLFQLHPPIHLETKFRYKAGESDCIFLVQMDAPSFPGWHAVNFNFEVIGGSPIRMDESELELVLYFEDENPLDDELRMFWPFVGRLLRVVE
ncbi:MAG TPA: hypothetical protein VHM90_08570 [Phycisphaerae bacterium]|nr:hypothetical protein [Phycisphaerae bacterium]